MGGELCGGAIFPECSSYSSFQWHAPSDGTSVGAILVIARRTKAASRRAKTSFAPTNEDPLPKGEKGENRLDGTSAHQDLAAPLFLPSPIFPFAIRRSPHIIDQTPRIGAIVASCPDAPFGSHPQLRHKPIRNHGHVCTAVQLATQDATADASNRVGDSHISYGRGRAETRIISGHGQHTASGEGSS